MICLIDADIVAYRCAASLKDGDGPEIANLRADILMRQILEETGSQSYKAFLSGSRNFRYDIYPEYKANRKDLPRPAHLQSCREFLLTEWDAEVTDGFEADDALGIANNSDCIISSIDKDLLQIPGSHHNIVTKEITTVDDIQACRTFYKQLLLGDRSDNIPGFDGMARQKPTKFLQGCYGILDNYHDDAGEMYEFVRGIYDEHGELENLTRNARLLYIWRKENDEWNPPPSTESL